MKVDVLDHGFVELVDHLGSDLTVVNSARVSYGKRVTEVGDSDIKLIHYLASHRHWSPFRHVQFQFHCKVPEFVARQWYKHVVGIAYSESPTVDHAWNEVSMRYLDIRDFDFHLPSVVRGQAEGNKQASTEGLTTETEWAALGLIQNAITDAIDRYEQLIMMGVAREQARMVMPLNIYTEFYWTASLQAVMNFIKLRNHKAAQGEIQEYARALEELIKPIVPVSYDALMETAPA